MPNATLKAANRTSAAVNQRLKTPVVRPARNREELEQAYRLVYSTYKEKGYLAEHPSGMRTTVYNAFPDTVTFVGKVGKKVVATATLFADTEMGLPMGELYGRELAALRKDGRKLVEVGMHANVHTDVPGQRPLFLRLMKQLFDYARLILQADDICITSHPEHARFFERFLLFEPLGGEKTYASVQGNPAVAQRLNLRTAIRRYSKNARLRKIFVDSPTPVRDLAHRHRMRAEDLEYFFVQKTSIFRNAPASHIELLRQMYPECPWKRWERSWKGGVHSLLQHLLSIPRVTGMALSHRLQMAREDLLALTGDPLAGSPDGRGTGSL
jgi:hypothetical protein